MKLLRILLAILSIPLLFIFLLPMVIFFDLQNHYRPSLEQARKNKALGLAIKANYKRFIDWQFSQTTQD